MMTRDGSNHQRRLDPVVPSGPWNEVEPKRSVMSIWKHERTMDAGVNLRSLGGGVATRRRSRVRGRLVENSRGESGSVLILALAYIVSISLIVGALADFAMNDLNNTTHFRSASSLNYAVSSTAQVAIQSIRYTPQMPATQSPALGTCWNPSSGALSELSMNSYTVAVWCSTVQNLASARTRVVTIYACPEAAGFNDLVGGGISCQANPYLLAQVAYDDYLPGGLTMKTTCTVTCGEAAKIEKWIWSGH